MGRKQKALPIEAFETIGERCKGNRRQPKRPQRFQYQFSYIPKSFIKTEPQLFQDLDTQQSINGNHFDINLNVKETIGRKRAYNKRIQNPFVTKDDQKDDYLSVSQTINDGVIQCEHQIIQNYLQNRKPIHSSPKSDRNQSNDRIHEFCGNVFNSTPKPMKKRLNYRNSWKISKQAFKEMPPKLFPVIEIENESEDINSELSLPPILYERTVLYNNTREDLNDNLIKTKKQKLFKWNRENELNDEFNNELNYNLEIEKTKKQLMEAKLHNELLRNQLIKSNNELNKSKNELNEMKVENIKLRQEVIDNKLKYESQITELKTTHWCVVCMTEAVYYCCWTGSYCSTQCQNHHWKNGHKTQCRRHTK